jgi:endo-1,4-beta-xylanase
MKFESLQPTEGVFNFGPADAIVEFAERNDMMVRGHALVWHRQTPAWMFTDAAGAPATEELLFTRLRDHITAVVGRYKGRVDAWDVVNEAFMDDGAYRTAVEEREDQRSPWYGVAQERYIAEAFRLAHEIDPDAKLFYNDYYNYLPEKRQAIHAMLEQLLAEGVPVHGVGLQAHLSIERSPVETSHGYYQTLEEEEAAIELYSSLGLEVHITELDMSLYIPGIMYTPDTFYTAATFTDEVAAKQAARYREFFELFRRHSDVITNVTFWGVADDNTWLSEFSSGRKDFPLLFDDAHQPKQAFEAITRF